MNYFKDEYNEVYYYDDEQIEGGYAQGKKRLTQKQLDAHLNPVPTKSQLDADQVAKAKQCLLQTDFYFTVDKYATLTEARKLELEKSRAEARDTINRLESN